MSILHPRHFGPRAAALALLLLAAPAVAQDPAKAPEVPPTAVPPSEAPAEIPAPPPTVPAPKTGPAAAAEDARAAGDARRVQSCKAHALARLKPVSPSIDDIFIDMDGLTIAAADLKIGETPVTSVIMGEAYIQRDRSDKVHRFLCLVGNDDAVLFTFFTER